MTGYVRVDTSNNIADGNVISAADLDNEFDGIQAAFNASTGHNHDGTTGEGAPISVLGPTQDVVVGASTVTPKTTNTVDIGSSSLKFKDLYLAGNASIGGTLAVTGVATFTAQPILSSLTASRAVFTDGSKGLVSNAITGTGNVVMSASPTLTGTITAAALTTSSTVTLNGGTANGVAYLNGSKVLTTGSALVFDGANLGIGMTPSQPLDVSAATPIGIRYTNTDATSNARIYATCGTSSGFLQQYGQSHATLPSVLSLVTTVGAITFNPSSVERMRISTAGGLSIGTTTDPGAGGLNITGNAVLGDATTDTVTVNGYMGVGGAGTSNVGLYLTSNALATSSQYGVFLTPTSTSAATTTTTSLYVKASTAAAAYTSAAVRSVHIADTTKGAGSTITDQQGLYIADQTQGTNNYGITSLVSSGSNKWNIYASGTAQNYFAGNVGIGVTTASTNLEVAKGSEGLYLKVGGDNASNGRALTFTSSTNGGSNGALHTINASSSTGAIAFATNSAERMRLFTSGGLSIGDTTDPGAGSLRVTGNTTLGDATTDTVTVNGYMGVGGAATSSFGLWVRNAALTGTSVTGIASYPVGTTSATTGVSAIVTSPGTAAATYTTASVWGIYVGDATLGAGSTINSQHGISIADQTKGTTNYGIVSSVSSGANKWNIYVTGTADNYFAGNVQFAAGSAAAPALSRFGDNNTGIFFPAADTIAFAEGGVEAMRLDSSGNVGIGTSSPGAKLEVSASGSTTKGGEIIIANSAARAIGNYSQIGFKPNSDYTGAVVGAFIRAIDTTGDVGNRCELVFGNGQGGTPTESMRIDNSGNVQISKGAVVVYAPAPASISTTATLTNANIQGQIINTTGTSYTVTMPLGSTMETLVVWATTNLGYDFTVINTASGTITMAVNTGVTSLGALTIATGTSAQFRIRRTAANTFVLYRMS